MKLKIKIFADGADLDQMIELNKHPLVEGFTCNPTLVRKAGIKNYKEFAKEAIKFIPYKPFSFEVISDNFQEMERQAKEISSWGSNVYVKIPVTNSLGESSCELISKLVTSGIKVNITAVFTFLQVGKVMKAIGNGVGIVSVFAGRLADLGINPEGVIKEAVKATQKYPNQEILWASPRESYNIIQADRLGCHIITCGYDLIKKTLLFGKSPLEYSKETVQMFLRDAIESGYTI